MSLPSGHSFPSSPLGFLNEYPIDRMNRRVWRSEKPPSVAKCAVRSSANTPAPQHTLLQTRDTMSAKARTAAGFRERGPRAVREVFCENHMRVVSMCACSKKDGSALFAKRRHCVMVQSRLTRAREQNHSFTSGGMCVLRRACRHQHDHQPPAGSSPAVSATAAITMSSCTTTCSATAAIVSCIGCPLSPPRWWIRPQLFDTAVHGVDELTETLSPVAASGRPPNTLFPDTWP